jgi:hypothetical protein
MIPKPMLVASARDQTAIRRRYAASSTGADISASTI